MPIRAQCDNCGKVYNLPDESAGKRLRCKQCAVAFTVPNASAPVAAAAPTVSVSVPAVQKICVVCKQDVVGKPRTKDQAGNYYCKSCYEEKARAREQVAVPAGVGAGDGGGDGDMIDLAALEGAEVVEQLDYNAQPPPPPIPDMDMVAPPIPDMEVEVIEAPKPKKKKKKPVAGVKGKTGKAAKVDSGDSFMSKMMALPLELYIVGVAVLIGGVGMISSTMAGFAFMGLVVIGLGCGFWGQICIVLAAFAEGTITGIMYLFVPFYWAIFLMTNWDDVKRHVLRVVLGVVLIIAGAIVMGHHGHSGDGDEDETPRVRSRSGRVAHGDEETAAAKSEAPAAAENPKAAAPPPQEDPKISVGVKFMTMLPSGRNVDGFFGDPADAEKRHDEIEDVILTSFEERGIQPPEGQLYFVEAVVEPGFSQTKTIKLADNTDVGAPILTCKLRVRDSVGRGNSLLNVARDVELPADAIAKASKAKLKTVYNVEWMNELLWKDVPAEFKALAAELKPKPGAAPAATNPAAKSSAPTEAATPAK